MEFVIAAVVAVMLSICALVGLVMSFSSSEEKVKDWAQCYLVSDQNENETQIYRTAEEIRCGFEADNNIVSYQGKVLVNAGGIDGVEMPNQLSLSLRETQPQFEESIKASGLKIVEQSDTPFVGR